MRFKVASEPRVMRDQYPPRILDVASSVLDEKDFRGIRIADGARKADGAVANGSIYLFFQNRPRPNIAHGCSRFRHRHHLIGIGKVSSSHRFKGRSDER